MNVHINPQDNLQGELQALAADAEKSIAAWQAGDKAELAGKTAKKAAVIEYGKTLLESRKKFLSDKDFGDWIMKNGLDKPPFNHTTTRANAQRLAEIGMKSGLHTTFDACPFTNPNDMMQWARNNGSVYAYAPAKPNKPAAATKPATYGPKTQAVHAALQANAAAGVKLPHKAVAQTLGVSPSTVAEAVRDMRGSTTTITYTKAQEAQIEARVKIRIKELEREFEVRVIDETKKRIDQLFPDLEKLREKAALNQRYYEEMIDKAAILNDTEYMTILACLHPDNSASIEKRDTAFKTFAAIKIRLTGKK